jgi:hypothetical protein
VAKRFFYVCAGLFLLAVGYGFGARNVGAQATGNVIVAAHLGSGGTIAYTANGDVYWS